MTVMCKMTSFDKGLKSSVITMRNKFTELKKEYKIGVKKYFNNNADNSYHFFGNNEKYSSNSQRTCSQ